MKRLFLAMAGMAMLVPAGYSSTGSGTTAPSTNREHPSAARKLTVKAPAEKSIKMNGAAEMEVSVAREHFSGPITIEVRDLPPGVTIVSQDTTIPADKDSITIAFKATADAKAENDHKVHVAARAKNEKDLKEDVATVKLDVKAKD